MGFAIKPSPEISNRNELSLLCNWRKLYRMVEVGVDRGLFAAEFLLRWQGIEYWGIDNYCSFPGTANARQADFLMAVSKLKKYADRARILRMDSTAAAAIPYFFNGSMDFIYIDGAHNYESVKTDIESWWPILHHQGILAGHDWTEEKAHAGVKQAVTEFAQRIDQTIYLTKVHGHVQEQCPSWYLYKSSMPGPDWRRC